MYKFFFGNEQGSFKDLYKQHERLGRGGFGFVHKVEYKQTKEIWAAKEILIGGLNPHQKQLIETEIDIMKKCAHEHIVEYREHFFENETVYIIMELCPNGDLRAAIKAQKDAGQPFSDGKLIIWFSQMLGAVVYLHNNKIIHRDIKPQNILLTANFAIKLTDFGVSKIQGNCMFQMRKFSKH